MAHITIINEEKGYQLNATQEEINRAAARPKNIALAAVLIWGNAEKTFDLSGTTTAQQVLNVKALQAAMSLEAAKKVAAEAAALAQKFPGIAFKITEGGIGLSSDWVEIRAEGDTFLLKEELKKLGFKWEMSMWKKIAHKA